MEPVFHIGYHKTATSWLQRSYFRLHPEIMLLGNYLAPWDDPFLSYLITSPHGKYDPIRGASLVREIAQDSAESDEMRKVLMFSAERLSGHPFSGGFDSFRIADRIAESFPNAKIVCVVRDQVDMIRSVYKQLISEGYPGTLEQLIDSRSWKTASFDLGYFEYDRLVSHYFSLFGSGRVCVLRYELLRDDIDEFLKQLCGFLGIEYMSPEKGSGKVNLSLPDASIALVRRLNYFRTSELYPLPLMDIGKFYIVFRKLAVRFSRLLKHSMRENIEEMLDGRYSDSNMRLSQLIDEKGRG